MNTIKLMSFYISRLCKIALILLPLYIIFKWLFIETPFLQYCLSLHFEWLENHNLSNALTLCQLITWTPFTKFLACLGQLCAVIPFIGILYFLSNIFHNYESGEVFTKHNAQYYYNIGKLLFVDALLTKPISGCLYIAAATFSNPIGHRYISIHIGTPNFITILLGLLVICISLVMIEASKIQDEQQFII